MMIDGQSLTVEVTTVQGKIVIGKALAQTNTHVKAQQRDTTNVTVATQNSRVGAGFGTSEGGKATRVIDSKVSY